MLIHVILFKNTHSNKAFPPTAPIYKFKNLAKKGEVWGGVAYYASLLFLLVSHHSLVPERANYERENCYYLMEKWKTFRNVVSFIQLSQGTCSNISSQKEIQTEPQPKTQATWVNYDPHSWGLCLWEKGSSMIWGQFDSVPSLALRCQNHSISHVQLLRISSYFFRPEVHTDDFSWYFQWELSLSSIHNQNIHCQPWKFPHIS